MQLIFFSGKTNFISFSVVFPGAAAVHLRAQGQFGGERFGKGSLTVH